MAHGQIGGLRVVNIAFEDIGARRVEEPVAHHRPEGTRCHDRLGDETIYGANNARSVESSTGDDFQRRVEGEMANECSEPAKHHTLQSCQESKAPIQRGLQCLLTRWRGSRPQPQQSQALIEKRSGLSQSIGFDASGRQFDCERHSVKLSADARDDRSFRIADV
jgi:hypothetical protein